MDQPVSRAEFDELKEEVRKLRETEPLRITDTILLQTLVTQVGTMATDVGTLKQAVVRIETNIEKRFDAIAEVQKQILDRLPKPPE